MKIDVMEWKSITAKFYNTFFHFINTKKWNSKMKSTRFYSLSFTIKLGQIYYSSIHQTYRILHQEQCYHQHSLPIFALWEINLPIHFKRSRLMVSLKLYLHIGLLLQINISVRLFENLQ